MSEHDDIDAVARAHERVGVKRHAQVHADRLQQAVKRGQISPEVADAATRQIGLFADDVLTGLHIEDHDSPVIRRTVRMLLGEAVNG